MSSTRDGLTVVPATLREPRLGDARARSRWGHDRGSAGGGSLGWLLVMPAVLLLLFGGLAFGLHGYARAIALAAAQAGVRAATAAPASLERGRSAAAEYLADNGSGILTDTAVTVTRSGTLITVTVTGQATQVIPLTGTAISQHAAGPAEALP